MARRMVALVVASLMTGSFSAAVPPTADAQQEECRWKVTLVKYRIRGTGGEKKVETQVIVRIGDDELRYPKHGFEKAERGEEVRVGEEIGRVTARPGGTRKRIVFVAQEKDGWWVFGNASGLATDDYITLDCSSRDFTQTWTLRYRNDGRVSASKRGNADPERWAYDVTLAFERVK